MRRVLPFAVAAALLAGVAHAQTETPAPDAAAAPASPPAASAPAVAKPKTDGDTVSGITVIPMPKKACSSRDKDCIAMVVAELKRLYPEELKRFCFAEQTSAVRTQIVNQQLLESLGGNNPSIPVSSQVSPVIKTACASDKK
jgi:hypothetical protein